MKKRSIITLISVLVFFTMQAQTMRQYRKAVNEAFAKQEYHNALQWLDIIQKIDSTDLDLQYKQAEAARLFNAFILAEKRYTQILKSEVAAKYPEAEFWLATVQKSQGKYDQAIHNFNQYLLLNPDTLQALPKEALVQIKACKWAKELIRFKDEDLKIKQLGETVNTIHSEVAPIRYQDQLIFSSLRVPSIKEKSDPPKKYTKVFTAKEGISEAMPFDLGYQNQDIHTAHVAFNSAETRMYFNICEYTDGSIIKCKIFYKEKTGDQWGSSIELPDYINQKNSTTTQPSLGFLESTGQEVLFFASDRIGGKGGLDLWYSPLDANGVPSPAINMENINTNKDDFTPFFHEYSQALYFSSNGRKSLGGHDVYKSAFRDNKWATPEHTGHPLNTSYNDVYFSLNKTGSQGYFASNREGTKLLEKDISACCYDIFEAEFNSFFLQLNVLTFEDIDGQKTDLEGVTVTLYEIFEDAEKEIAYRIKPEGNQHAYRIKSSKKYKIVAEKEGLTTTTLTFDTDNVKPDEVVVKEVILKKPQLQILTFDGGLETPLNGVTVSLQEIDKDGNFLATIPLKSAIDNTHFFPLDFNKHYRIIAKKDGFDKVEQVFSTFSMDRLESLLIKKVILQPEKEEDFIPIPRRALRPFPLYFDNDFPNPGSRDTVTEFTFPTTLEAYRARKEQFKAGYSKGLKGEQKIMAEYEVEKFFENEMDEAYVEFLKFTDAVLRRLKDFNRQVIIRVQAYTSPLASADYNLRLSKRRISSMVNFYRTYKNGAMKEYVDSGKLKIIELPIGEAESPNNISDNPYDRKNSVFSLEASYQRKVVIKEVESNELKAEENLLDNE